MAKLISKVYGDALFEAASQRQELDRTYEEVLELVQIFRGNADLLKMLGNPRIDESEKLSLVETLFSERISRSLMGLMVVAIKKSRQEKLPAICYSFISTVRKHRKIGLVRVKSAVELKEEQKVRLEAKLLETTDYIELQMYYTVEEALIGGIVIKIDDRVFDNSIRNGLMEMKKALMGAQLAQV